MDRDAAPPEPARQDCSSRDACPSHRSPARRENQTAEQSSRSTVITRRSVTKPTSCPTLIDVPSGSVISILPSVACSVPFADGSSTCPAPSPFAGSLISSESGPMSSDVSNCVLSLASPGVRWKSRGRPSRSVLRMDFGREAATRTAEGLMCCPLLHRRPRHERAQSCYRRAVLNAPSRCIPQESERMPRIHQNG